MSNTINAAGGVNAGRDVVVGNQNVINNPGSEGRDTRKIVAGEIQQILNRLSETYPTATVSEKMVVASKAIEQVQSDSSLLQKLVKAGKEGGIAALESLLNHPAASFFIAAAQSLIEDYTQAE